MTLFFKTDLSCFIILYMIQELLDLNPLHHMYCQLPVFFHDTSSLFLKFNFIYFLHSRFLLVIYFIHISVYMSAPISQFITPPPPPCPTFPPWCPYVCSPHPCLYFCLANQFICTIFLDSTYTEI